MLEQEAPPPMITFWTSQDWLVLGALVGWALSTWYACRPLR
jgi:hypothetical protein